MIDDYIDENNPIRMIDAFVDSLDLNEMGFRYSVLEEGPGRPSYDPSDLLKLYLWGYLYNLLRLRVRVYESGNAMGYLRKHSLGL